MTTLGAVITFAGMAVFTWRQAVWIDSYTERYGGPGRRERSDLFWRSPRKYLSVIRSGPPYGWKALIHSVEDPRVDAKRRQALIALAAVPVAFVLGTWVSFIGPSEDQTFIIWVAGGLGIAGAWAVIVVTSRRRTRLLTISALMGIVAGIAIALLGVMSR